MDTMLTHEHAENSLLFLYHMDLLAIFVVPFENWPMLTNTVRAR